MNNKKSNCKIIYNNDGSFNRVKINDNIFKDNGNKSIGRTIREYINNHVGEYAYIIESGQKVYLGEDLPGEYAFSKNTQNLSKINKIVKGRAAVSIKEIINNAKNRKWERNKKEKHKIDAKYGFYRYDVRFSFEYNGEEQIYKGKLLIRNDANGKKYLYDILNIKK